MLTPAITRRLRPMLAGAAVAALIVLAGAGPVRADVGGPVSCDVAPKPSECRVVVIVVTDGSDGHTGRMRCLLDGQEQPCYLPGLGWLHSDGCRYLRRARQDPPPAGGVRPGAWYSRSCVIGGGMGTIGVWFPDRGAPGTGVLIDGAVARLRPPAPVVRFNPGPPAVALVHMPTWLWVDAITWQPQRATAAAGGTAVTATATPVSVTWLPGDGSRLVCPGPGVAWSGGDPLGSSACAHTYTRPSAALPAGAYTLRATVTWHVTWTGAGSSGDAGTVTTTATTAVPVAEVQGLNVQVPR